MTLRRLDTPTPIDPGWTWDDGFKFIQAVRLGPWVFVSGQAALESDGRVAGPDMLTQARKTFSNMDELLQRAGGSLANVVQIRAYLRDFAHYPDYNRVRTEVLGSATFASTTVQVAKLYFDELLLEVDATAYIPETVPSTG
jgi:enamine deaminase RidA (YjgF/YER057c/UK114 family)